MSETVTLELPNSSYEHLAEWAARSNQDLADLAGLLLTGAIEGLVDDPLVKLAGVLETGIPDLAEYHDQHLQRQLLSSFQIGPSHSVSG